MLKCCYAVGFSAVKKLLKAPKYWMAILSLTLLSLLYCLLYQTPSVTWCRPITGMDSLETRKICGSSQTMSKDKKLLSIFTTFKHASERNFIQNNTIINWASLGDAVQPIIFANMSYPSDLVSFAIKQGWIGLPLQRTNSFGTPFLKDMYRKATTVSDSYFYGFCNGDILFDQSLIRTLKGVAKNIEQLNLTTMVIGRRTNVKVKDIYDTLATHKADLLSNIAKSRGSLFRTDAEDYFFMSYPGRFPWHTIKDVVIGRPAYDNYLVGQALHGNVSVIDATHSLLAFHQTGTDGNFAGALNKDRNYNSKVIGGYNYNSGTTSRAQYQTETDFKGNVYLRKRNFPKQKEKPKPTHQNPIKETSQSKINQSKKR